MKLFTPVLNAYRDWILSFSLFRSIQPYALYIMCAGLGLEFFASILQLINLFFLPINFLFAIAGLAFLIGLMLQVTTNDIKIACFGMFAKAFVILFPFVFISFSSIIEAAIFAFLGFSLLSYVNKEYQAIPSTLPPSQNEQQSNQHTNY